jgi:hypothetical protein
MAITKVKGVMHAMLEHTNDEDFVNCVALEIDDVAEASREQYRGMAVIVLV